MSQDAPFSSGSHSSQTVNACPLCRSSYTPLGARVIAQRDDAHLLYLQCRSCSAATVAVVMTGPEGLTSASALTDLTSMEVLDVQDRSSVTTNDVLELYDWLDRHPSPFATFRAS